MPFRADPAAVAAGDFPAGGTPREKLQFLLRFAILAPSVHNTQPWLFAIDASRIDLFADRSRWLSAADPDQRDLHLSLGCVLENLLVAARHFGYEPRVTYAPRSRSPDHVASVDLSAFEPPVRRRDSALDVLKRRRTGYRATDSRPLTPSLLEELEVACADDGVALFLSREATVRTQASRLFAQATAHQFEDESFREELSRWLGRGEYGLPKMVAKLGPVAVAQLEKALAREADRISAAPCFGAVLSDHDDLVTRIRAGQAFERAWLVAARWGVSLRPASAPCAVESTRRELGSLVGAGDRYVQQTLRIGYMEEGGHRPPRRRIDEILSAIPST